MASRVLPTVPWTIFCVLEPISLVAGWWAAIVDPAKFVTDQLPEHLYAAVSTRHAEVLSLQLGNLYLLMCLVGIGIIAHVKEAWILRNYLIILAIGDVGHLYGSVWGLGQEGALDFANYNHMAWGNIGATVFLLVTRTLTLLGVFGKLQDAKVKAT